jgi:pentatricopeptide repeat-containing protein PET309
MLAYFSGSRKLSDIIEGQNLFDAMDIETRTAEDYLNITTALLQAKRITDVIKVCTEAILQNKEMGACQTALAFFVNQMQWEDALSIWKLLRTRHSIKYDNPILSQIGILPNLPGRLLSLSNHLQRARSPDNSTEDIHPASFAACLLNKIFTTPDIMKDMTMEAILLSTRAAKEAGYLRRSHYYHAIDTLRSLEVRSSMVRSLVMYRNFRWHLPDVVPSRKLLEDLLLTQAFLEIPHGVHYLLREFVKYYAKPSIAAYKSALLAFSRSGKVNHVQQTFQNLLQDHGLGEQEIITKKPRSLTWVTPLLHVHARLGNVQGTVNEFRKLSPDYYGLKPNGVCWNILLSAYANAHDVNGALRTLKRMQAAHQRPTSYSLGTLMGICAKRGDINAVQGLFRAARDGDLPITTAMMDTIVEVYCRNHRQADAEKVAEASLFLNIEGSRTRMWNILLWSYAFRADLDAVSRVFARIEQAGLQVDGMTYAALMLCLCLIGKPDAARRLLRTLHRRRIIHMTESHYSIILFGYVRARNRDMAYIVYREIEERFESPGLSARLLQLRDVLRRDLPVDVKNDQGERELLFTASEDLLRKAIAEFDARYFATKQPRPATGTLPLQGSFPALYYEPLVKAYSADGLYERADQLLRDLRQLRNAVAHKIPKPMRSLRLISMTMDAHLHAGRYSEVEELWGLALNSATLMATPSDVDSILKPAQQDASDGPPPQFSVPLTPHSGQPSQENETGENETGESEAQLHATSVLPSRRFLLSRCLSLYFRALGESNQASRLPGVVTELENRGFSLTTHNWLTFVRTLAESAIVTEQFKAFVTFEEKFMPSFPGWHLVRRGIGFRPQDVPDSIDHLDRNKLGKRLNTLGKAGRQLWSKIDPTIMYPTYNVMIYLAAALIDFQERSVTDGGEQLGALFSAAPQTIRAIGEMPHLREKFQGVLLRQQAEQGDRDKRPREPYVWTGGILGVEGERRTVVDPEHEYSLLDAIEHQAEDDRLLDSDLSPWEDAKLNVMEEVRGTRDEDFLRDRDDSPLRTIDPQDEHDMEIETLLENRRRQSGIDRPEEAEDESSRSNEHNTATGYSGIHWSYQKPRNPEPPNFD